MQSKTDKQYDVSKNFVGIHWLSGSFPAIRTREIQDKVSDKLSELLWETCHWQNAAGLNGYQNGLSLLDGAILLLFDRDKEYSKRVHREKNTILFRGDVFDMLGWKRSQDLGYWIQGKLGVDVKRVDFYYQDVARLVDADELFIIAKNKGMRGFQTVTYHSGFTRSESNGSTLELGRRGSKGSGKFLRIYDKEAESKGIEKGIRWEVEFSGFRAAQALKMWVEGNCSEKVVAGLVFSVSAWIEPSKDRHKGRWQRLAWYEAMREGMENVKTFVPVEKTNIKKKYRWVHDSVSGTLAYMRAFSRYVDGCNDGFEGVIDSFADHGQRVIRGSLLKQLQHDIKEAIEGHELGLPVPSEEEISRFLECAA